MKKLITLLSAIFFSTYAQAKNVDVEVYDTSLRRKLVLNVNVYTGQYTSNVVDHFQNSLTVDEDILGMCKFVDKVLREDPTTYALALMNIHSKSKIRWKFFNNLRSLDYLEPNLNRNLAKMGYEVGKLTNLTRVLVENVEVKKIVWNSEALSLKNDDLLAKSEADIKRMLEVAPGRSSDLGYYEDIARYEFLYCDLLRRKVSIYVSLKGTQRKYYDENVTPLKVTLNRDVVSSLSEQLQTKKNEIVNLAKSETVAEKKSQIQLITSVGYLAQLLAEKNIKMSDFEKDEFFKLTSGVVNMTSGLPNRVNKERAYEIEQTLYRDAFNYNDTSEFELNAVFE